MHVAEGISLPLSLFSSNMVAMVFLHAPTVSSLPRITSHTSSLTPEPLMQNLRTIWSKLLSSKKKNKKKEHKNNNFLKYFNLLC